MDGLINLIKEIPIGTLIVMAAMFWFFYDRIAKKFDKVDERFDKVDNRLSKLEMDMVEVKTVLRLKECCMIQDDRQLKKVE